MNESELKRLLRLAEVRPLAPPDFRQDLWDELDSAWNGQPIDTTAVADGETVQLVPEERDVEPKRGLVVTLAAAAAVVVIVGLVPFLLSRSPDVPPPLSTPEIVVSVADVCVAFAEQGREVAHLITDSIDSEGEGSPWFLRFDPPPSNQLVVSDLQVLVNAMGTLISDLEQLDEVGSAAIESLRVIRGFYNQASIFLGRGDGGSASSSVDSAKGQWVQMSNRGLLEVLPGCYPGK